MNKKVNFLYIMVDQARSDFFGCYGNDKIKTPNIDMLAGKGIIFNPPSIERNFEVFRTKLPIRHCSNEYEDEGYPKS